MPMYRVLRPLSRKLEQFIPVGTLTDLAWLNDAQQAKLIQVGAVSRISAPPLAQLPGWKLRAGKLAALDIHTFDDFLEADPDTVAEGVGVQRRTVDKWRAELKDWVTVPQRGGRG